MTNVQTLLEWAWKDIYWAGDPPMDKHAPRPWNRQAALAALRNWLNEPAQSGVREELHTGQSQLGWDTPSAAGKRLISDLLWNTILARHGVHPRLQRPPRTLHSSYHETPEFAVRVIDAPYGPDERERSGWYVEVDSREPDLGPYTHALEWVLNAVLFYDVELGLTHHPLYRRRHRKEDEFDLAMSESGTGDGPRTGPPLCPKCGEEMAPKVKNRTGAPFWGCRNYPACDGARNWYRVRR
jgi:hypothetical protein